MGFCARFVCCIGCWLGVVGLLWGVFGLFSWCFPAGFRWLVWGFLIFDGFSWFFCFVDLKFAVSFFFWWCLGIFCMMSFEMSRVLGCFLPLMVSLRQLAGYFARGVY